MNCKSWFLSKQHLPAAALGTLFVFSSGQSHARITLLGDSYINTADPATNYGSQPLPGVNGASQTTYIQFNLASIPATASISQATRKLFVSSVTTAGETRSTEEVNVRLK
jgi:hypothetical protein